MAAKRRKKKDSRLKRAGVSGYNKPKRTPGHAKKSHIVVAKVGTKEVSFEVMPKQAITNMYKLYGELIYRQKTVKSFLQDHKVGSYIVTVAKHAFSVVDGVLIDNEGTEYKPTRKVQSAYKVVDKTADVQLKFLSLI